MSSGTQVELVKKASCWSVELQEEQMYLLMGSRGSEISLEHSVRWGLLLLLLLRLLRLLLPASPVRWRPGTPSLWTPRRCWSCGLLTVALRSVWTTFPSWRTLLWTCS